MADEQSGRSWWTTLPGVLTALATLITASAGFYTVIQQKAATPTTSTTTNAAESPKAATLPNDLPSKPASSAVSSPEPMAPGLLVFNGAKMSIKYDAKKWKQTASKETGKYSFRHMDGDGYGLVIAERMSMSKDALADVAVSNAMETDPNVKVVSKEKRTVNGVDVWFMKMSLNVNGIPVLYYGYYYGGEAGAVQVVMYTGVNLAAEYERDFMEFLNGLNVSP
jgi:hypothetical protein